MRLQTLENIGTKAARGGAFAHAGELALVPAPSAWSNSSRKRIFDCAVACLGLILSSPLMLVAALAVQATSEGDVLFRQQRVGRGNQTFTIYKFRTMCDGAEFAGPSVTNRDDPRTTPVGRLLRRFKIDEIPQLYNVIRGDMSLVGPRPKLRQHERMHMTVRPGITGAATLLFTREEDLLVNVPSDLVESYCVEVLNPVKARLDMRYAQHGSFASDLQLLSATVFRIGWDKRLADLSDLLETPETIAS